MQNEITNPTSRVDEITLTVAEILQARHNQLEEITPDDHKYLHHLLIELGEIAPHIATSPVFVLAQSIVDKMLHPKPAVSTIAIRLTAVRRV